MKKKKSKLKYGNIALFTILVICIGTLTYSVIDIIKWDKDNKKTEEITQELEVETQIIESTPEVGETVNPEENKESIYWSYIKMNLIDVNISELKEKNKDTVGWIQVGGTNINYPVVQTKNNDYYLTHSFDKKYTDAGWIFMDYRNNAKNFDRNTIIYGHARKDKSMFGSLKNILKNDWYKDINNHIMKLSTETENTLWQVFSVYHIETESYYIQTNFSSDSEFEEFISTLQKRSALKFDTTVNKDDHILTLSTCYNKKEKVVLHAKLIKKESK